MQSMKCMKLEAKIPKIDPVAALNACFAFFVSNTNSPINAPRKGPIIKPNGIGVNNPMMRPMLVPQIPALLPPNR